MQAESSAQKALKLDNTELWNLLEGSGWELRALGSKEKGIKVLIPVHKRQKRLR